MLQRLKNRIVDLVRLLWRELAKFGVVGGILLKVRDDEFEAGGVARQAECPASSNVNDLRPHLPEGFEEDSLLTRSRQNTTRQRTCTASDAAASSADSPGPSRPSS